MDSFGPSHAKYYTTLDSLIDTRLPILSFAYPEYTDLLLETDQYFLRENDSFDIDGVKLGYELWNPLYYARSKAILRYSGLTFIPYIISREILRHTNNNFNGECFVPWNLIINTYPYTLVEEEKESFLKIFIEYLDEIEVDIVRKNIQFVEFPYRHLTKDVLSEWNLDIILDYHGFEWLNYITQETETMLLPKKISLVIPKILNTLATDIQYPEKDKNFFTYMEKFLSAHMELTFLESYFFSNRILYMNHMNQKKKNIEE